MTHLHTELSRKYEEIIMDYITFIGLNLKWICLLRKNLITLHIAGNSFCKYVQM